MARRRRTYRNSREELAARREFAPLTARELLTRQRTAANAGNVPEVARVQAEIIRRREEAARAERDAIRERR